MKRVLSCLIPVLLGCAHAPLVHAQDVVWGGDHIEMVVAANSATIEFDCAHGAIPESLRPDADGRFKVAGTFGAERPGPSRGDGPKDQRATYSGTIAGDVMTLSVMVEGPDSKEVVYRLTRNRPGKLMKCR